MRSLILACGTALMLALTACSGGSASTPSTTGNAAIGLLDRLELTAGTPPTVAVVNAQQVRSLLKLPDSTPPLFSPTNPAQHHYADLLAAAVPWLASPYVIPALPAINFGQVTAAASDGPGREQVAVLATTQSFAQLANALSAHGYTRTGDLLYNPNSSPFASAQIAAIAGDSGIIALGNDPATVRAAAEGHAPGITGPIRDALASLSAPAAEAYASTGTCVSAIAISDDISGNTGRLLVRTATPDATRLTAGRRTGLNPDPPHLGAPAINGQQLTVPYTYVPPTDTAFDSIFEIGLSAVYQCH